MTNNIDIRQLTTMGEMHQVQEVEELVWNMPPTPVHQTYTALNNGGVILGAFSGEKMIGFLYSFAGFDGESTYLCSHMLGILPEYRRGGLGGKMKFKQAEVARKMGYKLITWTFDPLESLNAYVNIHKLGAVGAYYKPNHYGSMVDGLNQGLPTDRILIEWDLTESRDSQSHLFNSKRALLEMNEDSLPVKTEFNGDNFTAKNGPWFVAIPNNFQTLKQENEDLAREWRYETREVFMALFANGYKAFDVVRSQTMPVSYYLFKKSFC